MTIANLNLDEVRTFCGPEQVTERDRQIVISPRTTEEVAAVLRHAGKSGLAVEIVGGGTKRFWGAPVAADLCLDTTRLTGVREHSWGDLTATVSAGTTWQAMQDALATHRQHVALDPLFPATATVGGIIATNDSGAIRLKYGSLRDLVIGMTIVLADGTIARSGGKVVKNVAGYDLHKLMTGAYGTLGVITEVTFRLHSLPVQTRLWSILASAAAPLGALMMQVLDSHLNPQAMQLRATSSGFALDIELASMPEVLDQQVAALDRLAASIPRTEASADPAAFRAREALFAQSGTVVVKLTMLPTSIAPVSSRILQLGGVSVTQATGIMFARFPQESAAVARSHILALLDSADGACFQVLSGGDFSRTNLPSATGSTYSLMREIKRQFDPGNILNPGRLLRES